RDADRIVDILAAVERCHRYRDRINDGDTDVARMAIDAVVRNLEIVGEAVSRLSPAVTSSHPDVPWRAIVGMRNTLIHQYFEVHASVVIEAVDKDLEPLAAALQSHL